MNCKKIAVVLLLMLTTWVVSGTPIAFTVKSGQLLVKKAAQSEWTTIDSSIEIVSSDSVRVDSGGEAECIIFDVIALKCKDSCLFIINADEKKASLTLIRGQIFFNKEMAAGDITFEVKAKGCIFTPVGTAAAVKITPKGDPSIAVLRGNMRLTKPDGGTVDVSAGNYCTFNVSANAFTPVKPLPPKAVEALESWSGVIREETALQAKEEGKTEEAPALQAVAAETPSAPVADPSTEKTTEPPSETPVEKPVSEAPKEEEKEEHVKEQADVAKPASPAGAEKQAEKEAPAEEKPEKGKKEPDKPQWEISAGMVTVDNEQWTRIAFGVDVPIWRFGIFFDLELFLDAQGNFSNKGWDFSSGKEAGYSLLRKIRYIRFNHPGDPVFIKLGGLDNVTFGYGFVVDRFTNMLHYPGEKLFGLQFDLNDLSPVGISLQTLIPDFKDFPNDGGILAARLAFKPFKMTEKPVLGGLSLAATVASDLNQYAPARDWDYSLHGSKWDRDEDNVTDSTYLYNMYKDYPYYDDLVQAHKNLGDYDTKVEHKDEWAKSAENKVVVLGGDLIAPIVNSKLVNLDLYGQAGVMVDDENDDQFYKGWGIGAPGVGLTVGPVWARLEYRRVEDYFEPGYFGTYYLDERIKRTPNVYVKEDSLPPNDLNGVFGLCGVNIKNFVTLSGTYQRLIGGEGEDKVLDQRAEGEANVGSAILERIPKINKVGCFFYQTHIDKKKNRPFFYQSPYTFWGYRLGVEVFQGASVIWETRYGWKWNSDGDELVDDKTVTIQAALTF